MKPSKPAPTGSPFQVLRDLKGHLEPQKQAKAPPSTPAPSAQASAPVVPPPAQEDEDAALLAKAFAGAKPLGRDNHAHLEKAKPAPRPRPKQAEESVEQATPQRPQWIDPNDPMALFRASVGDVTPVKDTGRAEIGPRPNRQKRRAQAAQEPALALPVSLDPAIADDPAALFRHLAGAVTPLPDKNQAEIRRPLPSPRRRPQEEPEAPPTPAVPLSDHTGGDQGPDYQRPGAPARLLADLRRGRWNAETELDLHGFDRDEARQHLLDGLARCGRRDQRCLRVIHGKGLSSPGGEPLLKNLVRSWLSQHPEVLAFCETKPAEGGSGALLVLLRNPQRKLGSDEA